MKKLLIAFTAILLTTTAFAANKLPAPHNSAQLIDEVVAVVNNEAITQSQVDKAYKNVMKQIKAHHQQAPSESTLKKDILNQLIYQKLQLQLAKHNDITVTNDQINTAIKNIAKENHVSVATLKQKVQQEGTTYQQYREAIKKQITITMVQRQALGSKVDVSDAAVNKLLTELKSQKQFAKQYHIVDILVPLPSAPTSTQAKQAKVEALHIMKQLHQGVSIDAIKGAEVNDLGWRTKMDLPNLFAKQLPKLKAGGIAGPLRAANGYHVIKLLGVKKSSKPLPTRQQVKEMLMERKFEKLLHKWLLKLRKQSYVKIIGPQ